MADKHSGGCACGAIRIEFDADPDFIAACHGLDGKKASGGDGGTPKLEMFTTRRLPCAKALGVTHVESMPS